MKTKRWLGCLVALLSGFATMAAGQAQERTVARLFWQDDDTQQLKWGDLRLGGSDWSLDQQTLTDFPTLDAQEQGLVQMVEDAGLLLVGVRDQADGNFGSGWVAVETGAVEEPHGDHSHWRIQHSPRVLMHRIDDQQGNPAHLYKYGAQLVLANDRKNGFTITTAEQLRAAKTANEATNFYAGGNGHITLAVVGDTVAYSTWIAPAGPEAGRVDVVGIGNHDGKGYSISCPTGTLHGATTNQGKVFFAPADGVCWVVADRTVDADPASVEVHTISLGTDTEGKPLRTGAFANFREHVLFVSGKGNDAKLCSLNAAKAEPTLHELPLPIGETTSLTTPIPLRTRSGKRVALIFNEDREAAENDQLLVIDLDPNSDGDLSDAKLWKTVAIGRNQIAPGHKGHHDLAVLPNARFAVLSNPGDATLSLLSLSDFEIVTTLNVGGNPGRLIAVGE
ncbi:MAG: hypothetical protein EA381_13995 [Planctomycetaceae bacterium]|nr:MAG: hypothetical protein EA381_13995 [Planctomycetaceae bacterium]